MRMDNAADTWLGKELAGCRLRMDVCQDWANTRAAYRPFSNEAGHFLSARYRMVSHDGGVFMLYDTTEFTYRPERSEAIGITTSVNCGQDKAGRL